MKHLRSKKRGMTLAELMVSMALLSVVSLVTVQLYLSAQTEFELSSGTMTLNQRARTTIDRITQVVKTASPLLNNRTESFVHPNSRFDMATDMYEVDFVGTINFLPNPVLGSTWKITDPTSAAYINDPVEPRVIYENDQSMTSAVTRQPPFYRFRIAWNSTNTKLTGTRSNIPGRGVYLERLSFGNGGVDALDWGAGPNRSAYATTQTPDTGTPYSGGNMRPKLLGRNVHFLSFNRSEGNVILLRLRMYNRDPITLEPVEGITMKRPGFGGNKNRDGSHRLFVVDLVTNIQLPNAIQ